MNREIKFRAWLKDEKRMLNNISSIKLDIKCIYYDNNDLFSYERKSFDEIELMQYTGLKDKNGVEIYEDDIVEYYGRNAIVKIGFPHNDKLYPYGVCVEYIKYNLKEVEYLYKFNLICVA